MNAIDILALVTQAANTTNVLLQVYNAMNAEGRTEATPEETARVRALAVASDDRLSQAIARG